MIIARRHKRERFSPIREEEKTSRFEEEYFRPEVYGSFVRGITGEIKKDNAAEREEKEKDINIAHFTDKESVKEDNSALLVKTEKADTALKASPALSYSAQKKVKASYEKDTTFSVLLMFCFMGAVISGYLFYRSFYRIATSNAKPIALITNKYRTAQRKFIGSMAWDRIEKNSAIYNGDTIHTGELSELTVRFSDGNIIVLSDNSMVQVFLNEKGEVGANLSKGSAKVDASEGANGFKLGSGDVSVTVQSGSTVSATTAENDSDSAPLLQVVKGNVSVEAADGEKKELEAGDALLSGGDTPSIIMLYPMANDKLVYYDEGEYMADFKWICDTPIAVTLEVSEDKEYKRVIRRIETDTNEAQIRLPPARYYWRVKNGINTLANGKMTIIQSLPPKAASPLDGYLYTYRKKMPDVRLVWTESCEAVEYEVNVASIGMNGDKNSVLKRRTPLTSMILPSMSEGVYEWNVTAFMDGDVLGYPSEARTFTVEHKALLDPPALYLPKNKDAVNIRAKGKGGKDESKVLFTWKTETEASAYRIGVYEDESLTSKIIDDTVEVNRYSIAVNKFTADTQYWWCVSTIDSEGNESRKSEVRKFTAMDGEVEQQLEEPSAGYTVEDTFIKDMKFAWKKKVPYGMATYLEVSRDGAFKDIVYDKEVEASSITGLTFTPGSYYWRIRTRDMAESEDAFDLAASARELFVVPPLPPVQVITPIKTAIVKEDMPYRVSWKAVKGAEFYRIEIFDKSTGNKIYSNTVYGMQDDIDMFHDKSFRHRDTYRYEIQGVLNSTSTATSKRSGKVSADDFMFIKVMPVIIITPKENDVLDGIDTLLNGIEVRYSANDALSSAQVVLSKLLDGKSIVLTKYPSDEDMRAGNTIAPNPLRLNLDEGIKEGTYEIAINAATKDALDISTSLKGKRRFSVSSISPLQKASSFTASSSMIDASYIKENKGIVTLNWSNVQGATDYDFTITEGNKDIVKTKVIEKEGTLPYYTLDIMSLDEEARALFTNGEFICTVKPYRRIGDKVVQSAEASVTSFTSNIASPKKSITLGTQNPYSLK